MSTLARLGAVFLMSVTSLWLPVQAQELKIGVMNLGRLMSESDAAKSARARIEAEFGKRQRDLKDLDGKWVAAKQKFEKDEVTLGESERVRRRNEIADMERELQRRDRDLQEDVKVRVRDEDANLQEVIRNALDRVVAAEKFDLVLQADGIVYASGRVDITEQVLKAMNARAIKPSK